MIQIKQETAERLIAVLREGLDMLETNHRSLRNGLYLYEMGQCEAQIRKESALLVELLKSMGKKPKNKIEKKYFYWVECGAR